MATLTVPERHVRLACMFCDEDQYDGITEEQLGVLKTQWKDIDEFQTYEDSIGEISHDQASNDQGKSVFDWYTHIGVCPPCAEANDWE